MRKPRYMAWLPSVILGRPDFPAHPGFAAYYAVREREPHVRPVAPDARDFAKSQVSHPAAAATLQHKVPSQSPEFT